MYQGFLPGGKSIPDAWAREHGFDPDKPSQPPRQTPPATVRHAAIGRKTIPAERF
jgi:hypothetical protein